ncbi:MULTISPECIES: helix-turn-helix domain-containing protein [Streptomyces]|uniref:Helix-turn-helix domain-containing protein n=1 Tax=Streptomyces ramulosus TaxID=47762 RepID=A0ABW1FJ65_9ACTN
MQSVPGHQNRAANVRRKPLAPLPAELTGPVRDFVTALRRMHGELGYSLKEMESRLPASRSSLSRYLRGQSLPDERLLVEWCRLSLTGEDRLPALVTLLHAACAAQESSAGTAGPDGDEGAAVAEAPGPFPAPGADGVPNAHTATGPAPGETAPAVTPHPPGTVAVPGPRAAPPVPVAAAAAHPAPAVGRQGWSRSLLIGLGAAVAVATALTVLALTGSGRDSAKDSGTADASGTAAGSGGAESASGAGVTVNVFNVERGCRGDRGPNCALGLARDPYEFYRRPNVAGHVWHDDTLHARCRIADGVSVTDEAGGHSSIWLRVDHDGGQAWMPGIRIRPEQLQNADLPVCHH